MIVKSDLDYKKSENYNFPDIVVDEKPLNDANKIVEVFSKKLIEIAIEIGVCPCDHEALSRFSKTS